MRRPRHVHGDTLGFSRAWTFVGNPESPSHGSYAALERLTGFHGLALVARPGAEPALPWPGTEISVVLSIREGFHHAFGAYLAVAVIPVKNHRGPAVGLEFPTFARPIVGVENDVAQRRVDLFAEYDSRRWVAAFVHGRQHHGVGIGLGGICPRLRQPLCHGGEGIPRQGVRQSFRPMCLYAAAHTRMVAAPVRLR